MGRRGDRTNGSGSAADLALDLAKRARLPVLVVEPRTGRIQTVNEAFSDVFHWEAEDLEGHRFRALVSEEDRWDVRNLLSVTAYGGSQDPSSIDLKLPDHSDGDALPTSWSGVPNILDDPTKPVAIVCRPKGKTIGRPVGPPDFLQREERDELKRIPPRQKIQEDRRMGETSRYLWERDG